MRSMMKRSLSTVFATAASVGLLVAAAPAATAAPASSVAAGQALFWTGTNYTGSQYIFNAFNGCRDTVAGVRSSTNNTGFVIEVWSGRNCTGTRAFAGSSNHGFAALSVYSCSVCRTDH